MNAKRKLSSYLGIGALTGLVATVAALTVYYIFGLIMDYETAVIGKDQDRLFVVFIVVSTFIACLIAGLFYYFVRNTARPFLYLVLLVLAGFLINTFTAINGLHPDYELSAHVMHVVVAAIALWLIPGLTKKA